MTMTPPAQVAVNDPVTLLVVAGTDVAGMMLPHLARQFIALHAQRTDTATQVEALMETRSHY